MTISYDYMMRQNVPFEEKLNQAVVAFVQATNLLLALHREYLYGGQWNPRILQKVAPEMYEKLSQGFQIFVKTQDSQPFAEAIAGLLEQSGGRVEENRTDYAPNRRIKLAMPPLV